jgi:hypothetical protein
MPLKRHSELGISLHKGMGTKQIFIDLAERYCQLSFHQDTKGLTREIAIAKT